MSVRFVFTCLVVLFFFVFRYVQSLSELLRGQSPSQIAAGHNSFIQLSRVGDFLKVTRTYNDEGGRKVEHVFKFESFAIQVREQSKQYAKAASAVYQTLGRGKDDKRSKAVSEKLMVSQFENASNTLKELFSTTTVLPRLADKFKKQQENKNKSKKINEADLRAFKKQITDQLARGFMEKDPASMIPSEEDDIVQPVAPAPKEEKPAPVAEKKPENKKKDQAQAQQAATSSSAAAAGAAPAPRREKKDTTAAGLKFSSNPYEIGTFSQTDLAKMEDVDTERQLAQAESSKKPPVKAKKPKQDKPAQTKPAAVAAPTASSSTQTQAATAATGDKKSPQQEKKPAQQEQPKKKEKQPEKKPAQEQPKKAAEPAPKPKQDQQQAKAKTQQLNAAERAKAQVAHAEGEKETGKKVAQKLKSKQPEKQQSQDLLLYGGAGAGLVVLLFLFFTYGLPILQAAN